MAFKTAFNLRICRRYFPPGIQARAYMRLHVSNFQFGRASSSRTCCSVSEK
jgi:hypothetical protein